MNGINALQSLMALYDKSGIGSDRSGPGYSNLSVSGNWSPVRVDPNGAKADWAARMMQMMGPQSFMDRPNFFGGEQPAYSAPERMPMEARPNFQAPGNSLADPAHNYLLRLLGGR